METAYRGFDLLLSEAVFSVAPICIAATVVPTSTTATPRPLALDSGSILVTAAFNRLTTAATPSPDTIGIAYAMAPSSLHSAAAAPATLLPLHHGRPTLITDRLHGL